MARSPRAASAAAVTSLLSNSLTTVSTGRTTVGRSPPPAPCVISVPSRLAAESSVVWGETLKSDACGLVRYRQNDICRRKAAIFRLKVFCEFGMHRIYYDWYGLNL